MSYFEQVIPTNIVGKFRVAFETYDTANTWLESLGTDDLVFVDGNAAAASYLVISKNPLVANTETSITSRLNFTMPFEVALGLSMSQRTLGQEFALEVVDTGNPLPDVNDLAISSISQTTTFLTIETTSPHGLSVGKSIGVRGCSNTVANYPSLVVANCNTPTQIVATAGPGGAIPSQTISNPAGDKGFVYFRERLGRANNGIALIFENATATNGSFYTRSESGDAYPSGTVLGNHSLTIGTTAPIQLINSPFTYSFSPTTEYRFVVQADRNQFSDSAVDTLAASTNRLVRTQVCPDPTEVYKFRIRAVNNKALTVPNAQIVSAVKSGTTTATITTATAHGLTAADPVVIYGIRDQAAASFPNLLTATAVASVIDSTTFTIVIGTASTVTSYGGYVARVNGGNLMSALGGIAQVIQSATLSTLSDSTRQLVLVGSAAWAGLSIGDNINVVGCRNIIDGSSIGVDGAWKVANIATTTLTLVPLPGNTPPADFVSTNCGGAIIKRTDLRLSYVRIFDFERQRVEMLARPAGDISAAAPVTVQNSPAVTISSGTVTTVSTVTSATTVGTVTNQTNMGGQPATEQIPSLMRLGADSLRRNISVT
jgi:hypothetical protein